MSAHVPAVPNPNAPAPRGILKNKSEVVVINHATIAAAAADASSATVTTTTAGKRYRWDEENLDQNEAEKVPRMKIDEPDTPFHYSHAVDDDDGAGLGHVVDDDSGDSEDGGDRRVATTAINTKGNAGSGRENRMDATRSTVGAAAAAAGAADDLAGNPRKRRESIDAGSDERAAVLSAAVASLADTGDDGVDAVQRRRNEWEDDVAADTAATAKTMSFEEKRKQHYKMKNPLTKKVNPLLRKFSSEEEDEDD